MSSRLSPRESTRAEAPRTNQAIIRSFSGRVLTVTVLASHKRALSFDSCLLTETSEVAAAKRARLLDDDEQRATDGAADNAEAEHAPAVPTPHSGPFAEECRTQRGSTEGRLLMSRLR